MVEIAIAIAWLGLCLVCLILLVWELKNVKPCPPDCIDRHPDFFWLNEFGRINPRAWADANLVVGYDFDSKDKGVTVVGIYGKDGVLRVLGEQGAGDAYMQRVKEQLCGPFGKLMP